MCLPETPARLICALAVVGTRSADRIDLVDRGVVGAEWAWIRASAGTGELRRSSASVAATFCLPSSISLRANSGEPPVRALALNGAHLQLRELGLERRELQLRVATVARARLEHGDRGDRGKAQQQRRAQGWSCCGSWGALGRRRSRPVIARRRAGIERRSASQQSGRPDSNRRLLAPKASALPGCATPRCSSVEPTPLVASPADGGRRLYPRRGGARAAARPRLRDGDLGRAPLRAQRHRLQGRAPVGDLARSS